MSKLNIDQKSVRALFSEKKADFLIPDYQRPYAWGERNARLFGMTCSYLHFLIMTATNSTVTAMSIFSAPSSHLKMMTVKWRLLTDNSALRH